MERYCCSCMALLEENACFCTTCGFRISDYRSESHQLKPGTLLRERYTVGKVLGQGGFGITYVGKDTVLDRKVAVKEFYMAGYVSRHHTISDAVEISSGNSGALFTQNREKFLLEARTLAKFGDEAGIVNVLDFFRENNTAYIVMDFLDGMTLRDYVNRVGKISGDRMLQILEPVVHSLTNVHKHGLIHRDISPDNIMLTRDGKVKLLDFGAAREVSQTDIKSLSIILKPGYAPEEQYRSKGHQGPWTDVYALCATMYRCITGIVPDDAMERMHNDSVVPPAELDCDCSQTVSDVIMKGMRIRREERYQSLPELWSALTAPKQLPKTEPVWKPEVPGGSYRIVPPKGKDEAFVWRREEAPKSEPKPNPSEGAYRIVPDKQKNGSNDAFVWHREEPKQVTSAPKQQTQSGQKAQPEKKAEPVKPEKKAAPARKTKAQAKKVQKQKKKRKWPYVLWLLIMLAIIGAIVNTRNTQNNFTESIETRSSSGVVPAPFNSYELIVAGDVISLPTTIEALENMGWVCAAEAPIDSAVAEYQYTSEINMQKQDIILTVEGYNPTDRTLSARECPVVWMKTTGATVTTANNFVVEETTLTEFEASAPTGYSEELLTGTDIVLCRYSEPSDAYYQFTFWDGLLSVVDMANYSGMEALVPEESYTE